MTYESRVTQRDLFADVARDKHQLVSSILEEHMDVQGADGWELKGVVTSKTNFLFFWQREIDGKEPND